MKKKLVILSSLGLSFMPMLALAQTTTISTTLYRILGIINVVVPIIIALGVVYFVWGVVQYVISDDEAAKKAGKDRMIYGIIGLVVIVAMWGLVNMVIDSFALDTGVPTDAINNLVP